MVTEPQIWTIIGVLAATLVGMVTLTLTVTHQTIVNAIGGLRGELLGEMKGLRGELNGEINGLRSEMNARFDAVNSRFDAVNTRIDALDRDVQAIAGEVFGRPRS